MPPALDKTEDFCTSSERKPLAPGTTRECTALASLFVIINYKNVKSGALKHPSFKSLSKGATEYDDANLASSDKTFQQIGRNQLSGWLPAGRILRNAAVTAGNGLYLRKPSGHE